ncbi:MAG: hypothetical protein C4522_19340 [Desulfobacteraceae bacterium]|nr:MAG: hypothetical protein C4522_19340 [Desulfobacteraceae bacterium]
MGIFWMTIGILIGGSIGIFLMAAACLASRSDSLTRHAIYEYAEVSLNPIIQRPIAGKSQAGIPTESTASANPSQAFS